MGKVSSLVMPLGKSFAGKILKITDMEDSVTPDHLKLVESINRRVESIYNQLCEFEESIDPRTLDETDDTPCKIMDLLKTLDDIQVYARSIRPYNLTLHSRQKSLEEQIKCLEQSMDLMKLETGKTSENDEGGGKMNE